MVLSRREDFNEYHIVGVWNVSQKFVSLNELSLKFVLEFGLGRVR